MPNVGTNWAGSYSRFSYDESKQYFMMLKEQGVPVLDDEFNVAQDMILTMVRRFVQDTFGDGSPNNGFKIVGTGATNDFTITGGNGTLDGAGHLYVAGWMLLLQSDVAYLSQPVAPAALTTPAGGRTDEVYVDIYVDEVGPLADTVIKDPTLNIETSRRLKLFWQVKVAEGATTPASYTDANSRKHVTYKLATINRTSAPTIQDSMVIDARKPFVDPRVSVLSRLASMFAPHEETPPTMSVRLDAGYVFVGGVLTTVAAQSSPGISAPTTNPRITRITLDAITRLIYVVSGAENAVPVAPAVPAGKIPIAQVLLQPSTVVIKNSMLTDERLLDVMMTAGMAGQAGGLATLDASGALPTTQQSGPVITYTQVADNLAGGDVNITGLDGNALGRVLIEIETTNPNTTGAGTWGLRFNNDTTINYRASFATHIAGNAAIDVPTGAWLGQYTAGIFLPLAYTTVGGRNFIQIHMNLTSGNVRSLRYDSWHGGTTDSRIGFGGGAWSNQVSNITSLQLYLPNLGIIGAGSTVRIFKLR